jgi:hypothetical protein
MDINNFLILVHPLQKLSLPVVTAADSASCLSNIRSTAKKIPGDRALVMLQADNNADFP